ncbi:MAG TPA: tRNA uridine-5-carboxymethylaminomethyl(34) synthesis enzyme MnmG [Thermoanaerobaculia bacterium]|nr:tRNA uridine-5-carboxymethylaminomethyl(34) synthesis enzyme MnmG [Thermoanaerobaculia bacterium]
MNRVFDVIVVGGGHAGAEAARICARGGLRVALVTMIRDAIGRMSCNPAIGGLAKGNLVKEIDALGGLMGEATDRSGIQFKILNRSKGPAVQGPRAQCDRDLYSLAVRAILDAEPDVTIVEGAVSSLIVEGHAVRGTVLVDGTTLTGRATIVTTGTFLRSLMHSGEVKTRGGRFGEPSAETLSNSLQALGLRLGRLKTGTPPRVVRDSVDFRRMEEAPGDDRPRPFSILSDRIALPQVLCHLTYTGDVAHALIRTNLHRAPMYSGQIRATGPRYCPSIEDKVVRFAEKERHQVFVEPEGLDHPWLYLNGISTSLPPDVQDGVVRSLPGMEHAVIGRYGYAVEYDFVNPEQLEPTLQVRGGEGLFLAGQINGTSGYEEAAAQGLLAGINALQHVREEEPLILRRDQAYAGVMIDDLVTLGTEEPYRMFTSRAEHRLLLGCDSVYERLSPIADRLGLLDDGRKRRTAARLNRMRSATELAEATDLKPDRETREWLAEAGIDLTTQATVGRLMQRHAVDVERLLAVCDVQLPNLAAAFRDLTEDELEGVMSRLRYSGYIERQQREAAKLAEDEDVRIPADMAYELPGLSREMVEKLNRVRPVSLGQASRISGVTPAAVSILRLHVRQRKRRVEGSGASNATSRVPSSLEVAGAGR